MSFFASYGFKQESGTRPLSCRFIQFTENQSMTAFL